MRGENVRKERDKNVKLPKLIGLTYRLVPLLEPV